MPTWIWIVIAVVVVLAIALGTGLALARRRRISLTDAAPPPKPEVEGPPAKGGYKAGGSISFSSAAGPHAPPTAAVAATAPPIPAARPHRDRRAAAPVGDDAGR